LDILEVVAKLRPDVFGKKKLVEALDKGECVICELSAAALWRGV